MTTTKLTSAQRTILALLAAPPEHAYRDVTTSWHLVGWLYGQQAEHSTRPHLECVYSDSEVPPYRRRDVLSVTFQAIMRRGWIEEHVRWYHADESGQGFGGQGYAEYTLTDAGRKALERVSK
jgi:hypothetical protein